MNQHVTSCGIPGIGPVPRDFHICHFYPTRKELLEALVPYFEAGLSNNERCIWIASDPLPASEIMLEIASRPMLDLAEKSGTLTIWDARDWYGEDATLDADAAIQRWIDEEERALAGGYLGLRITGNTSFVGRDHWDRFMEYEKKFHQLTRDRRIVACCSYSRHACCPTDVLEITRNHNAAMDRDAQNWHIYLQQTNPQGASRRLRKIRSA